MKTEQPKRKARKVSKTISNLGKMMLDVRAHYAPLTFGEKAEKLEPFALEFLQGGREFMPFFLVADVLFGEDLAVAYIQTRIPEDIRNALAVQCDTPELQRFKANEYMKPYFEAIGVPFQEAA